MFSGVLDLKKNIQIIIMCLFLLLLFVLCFFNFFIAMKTNGLLSIGNVDTVYERNSLEPFKKKGYFETLSVNFHYTRPCQKQCCRLPCRLPKESVVDFHADCPKKVL